MVSAEASGNLKPATVLQNHESDWKIVNRSCSNGGNSRYRILPAKTVNGQNLSWTGEISQDGAQKGRFEQYFLSFAS